MAFSRAGIFAWMAVLAAGSFSAGCGQTPDPNPTQDPLPTEGSGESTGTDSPFSTRGPRQILASGPCLFDVCWEELAEADYPERWDPPQHALHCNETGAAQGCPAGYHCGPVQEIGSRRIPVCEPDGDDNYLHMELPSIAPGCSVRPDAHEVTVDFTVAGEQLPAVLGFDWLSFATFTHRDGSEQVTIRVTDEPAMLCLTEGIHDVRIDLNANAFANGAPAGTQRGLLTVRGPGNITIDRAAASLDIALRFQGSALTSAESSATNFRLESLTDENRARAYVFSGGERGRKSISLTPDTYQLTVNIGNGQLAGLFPLLPYQPDEPVTVPETASVRIELEPVRVTGRVVVDGETWAEKGIRIFSGGGSLALNTNADGEFGTLLWRGQPYDVFVLGTDGALIRVRPAEAEFALASDTFETFSATLTATTISLSTGHNVQPRLRITQHVDDQTDQVTWTNLSTSIDESASGGTRWLFPLMIDADLPFDVAVYNYAPNTPQAAQVASDLRPGGTIFLGLETSSVRVGSTLRTTAGDVITGHRVSLYPVDGSDGFTIWNTNTNEAWDLLNGRYNMRLYPGWQSDLEMLRIEYDLGEVEVDGPGMIWRELELKELRGEIWRDGVPLASEPNGYQRGQIYVRTPLWGTHYINIPGSGDPSFSTWVGPTVLAFDFRCWSERCNENGTNQPLPLYDAIEF